MKQKAERTTYNPELPDHCKAWSEESAEIPEKAYQRLHSKMTPYEFNRLYQQQPFVDGEDNAVFFSGSRRCGKSQAADHAMKDAVNRGVGCYRIYVNENGDLASEKIDLFG